MHCGALTDVSDEFVSSDVSTSEFAAPDGVMVDAQVEVPAKEGDVPGLVRAPKAPNKPTVPKALTATPAVIRSSFRKAAPRARILL